MYPQRVAFSPDGALVAATGRSWKPDAGGEGQPSEEEPASDEESPQLPTSLAIYELANGLRLHTAPAHATQTKTLAFLQDGKLILTSASDGTVRLWGVKGDGKAPKE